MKLFRIMCKILHRPKLAILQVVSLRDLTNCLDQSRKNSFCTNLTPTSLPAACSILYEFETKNDLKLVGTKPRGGGGPIPQSPSLSYRVSSTNERQETTKAFQNTDLPTSSEARSSSETFCGFRARCLTSSSQSP